MPLNYSKFPKFQKPKMEKSVLHDLICILHFETITLTKPEDLLYSQRRKWDRDRKRASRRKQVEKP